MPILDAEKSLHPDHLLTELSLQDQERSWWTIYTKARQEKAFARQLICYDIPFYLPLVPKENIIRGKRVNSHIPLFSGYVFLFGTEAERTKSLTTNRISSILPVTDQEQLRSDLLSVRTLIEADAPLTVEKMLIVGDRVRVKHGAMAGLEGRVVKRKGKARLQIAVNMLHQGVSAEIDDFMLEPV